MTLNSTCFLMTPPDRVHPMLVEEPLRRLDVPGDLFDAGAYRLDQDGAIVAKELLDLFLHDRDELVHFLDALVHSLIAGVLSHLLRP